MVNRLHYIIHATRVKFLLILKLNSLPARVDCHPPHNFCIRQQFIVLRLWCYIGKLWLRDFACVGSRFAIDAQFPQHKNASRESNDSTRLESILQRLCFVTIHCSTIIFHIAEMLDSEMGGGGIVGQWETLSRALLRFVRMIMSRLVAVRRGGFLRKGVPIQRIQWKFWNERLLTLGGRFVMDVSKWDTL